MTSRFHFQYSRPLSLLFSLALLCSLLSGCLIRTHQIARTISTANLKSATLAELVEKINRSADAITTLNATVDIDASTGGQKKGKVTDYFEVHGFVLVRKPEMLRVIGLVPVVRNHLFDMVSDGHGFQLYIPAKNKVVQGGMTVTKPSANALENLRPDVFFDSLMLQNIAPDEIPFLRVGTRRVLDGKSKRDVEEPNYIVAVLRKKPDNDKEWYLHRLIFFNRENLQIYRQEVLDEHGETVTDADYSPFTQFDGTEFPSQIDIMRPVEEYEIRLIIDKLTANKPITDEQFDPKIPADAQVKKLD